MARSRKREDDFDDLEIDQDMPIFTTGVVCRILEIPVWVLKQLDAEGLVCPPRKKEGQSRLYSQRELKKVNHCWRYIRIHKVKIPGLKIILKMERRISGEK